MMQLFCWAKTLSWRDRDLDEWKGLDDEELNGCGLLGRRSRRRTHDCGGKEQGEMIQHSIVEEAKLVVVVVVD
jgi:hypothetical protein